MKVNEERAVSIFDEYASDITGLYDAVKKFKALEDTFFDRHCDFANQGEKDRYLNAYSDVVNRYLHLSHELEYCFGNDSNKTGAKMAAHIMELCYRSVYDTPSYDAREYALVQREEFFSMDHVREVLRRRDEALFSFVFGDDERVTESQITNICKTSVEIQERVTEALRALYSSIERGEIGADKREELGENDEGFNRWIRDFVRNVYQKAREDSFLRNALESRIGYYIPNRVTSLFEQKILLGVNMKEYFDQLLKTYVTTNLSEDDSRDEQEIAKLDMQERDSAGELVKWLRECDATVDISQEFVSRSKEALLGSLGNRGVLTTTGGYTAGEEVRNKFAEFEKSLTELGDYLSDNAASVRGSDEEDNKLERDIEQKIDKVSENFGELFEAVAEEVSVDTSITHDDGAREAAVIGRLKALAERAIAPDSVNINRVEVKSLPPVDRNRGG